jgi:glycerate dehydrogenase
MKIVVLDGLTLNPGDLSWDGLYHLGDVEIHDRTFGEQIIERSKGAEILFTNKTPLGEDEFAQLPDLKYIGVLATGYNIVDIEAAKKRNITVTNIPAYSTNSVAQMTFALILELCLHVQEHSNAVHSGDWVNSPDFSFWKTPLIELADKTMGIIGFGSIGQQVAKVAEAFGMKVIAAKSSNSNSGNNTNVKRVDLDELLRESDIVSLHCPLFPSTKGIINKGNIEKMKKSAFLINTARGPLIVEEDLAEALNSGRIAGAGVDVLSTEPPKADNPLLTAKNCLITPHISWATFEARTRLMNMAVDNLKAFLQGNPINVVSI